MIILGGTLGGRFRLCAAKFFGMMVARDGVEPPTPAFSELGYLMFSMTWNARTTP